MIAQSFLASLSQTNFNGISVLIFSQAVIA
jgi:hypothetical protein